MPSPHRLTLAFLEADPEGAAKVLETFTADAAAAFLGDVPTAIAAPVVDAMQTATAARVVTRLAPDDAAALILAMAHGRASLVRLLPDDYVGRVLEHMPTRTANRFRKSLAYPPGTVGAWMDPDVATFPAATRVGDCLARIRAMRQKIDLQVFVTGDRRRLAGVAGLNDLLGADEGLPLSAVAARGVRRLSPHATLKTVSTLPDWDRALSLPVTTRGETLLGVLHFDGVRAGLAVDRPAEARPHLGSLLLNLGEAYLLVLAGLLQAVSVERPVARSSQDRER